MIKQEASFVRFVPKWENPPSSIFSSTMTRATGASLKANMLSCAETRWLGHFMICALNKAVTVRAQA